MPGMIYTIYRNNRFELKVARHSNIANGCLFFTKKNPLDSKSLDSWISGQRSTHEFFTIVCVCGVNTQTLKYVYIGYFEATRGYVIYSPGRSAPR